MKLQCSCGAKYTFDVSADMAYAPVHFVCSACGLDSSAYVTQLVHQQLGVAMSAAPSAAASGPPPAAIAPPPPDYAPPPRPAAGSTGARGTPPPAPAIAPPPREAASVRTTVSLAADARTPAGTAPT